MARPKDSERNLGEATSRLNDDGTRSYFIRHVPHPRLTEEEQQAAVLADTFPDYYYWVDNRPGFMTDDPDPPALGEKLVEFGWSLRRFDNTPKSTRVRSGDIISVLSTHPGVTLPELTQLIPGALLTNISVHISRMLARSLVIKEFRKDGARVFFAAEPVIQDRKKFLWLIDAPPIILGVNDQPRIARLTRLRHLLAPCNWVLMRRKTDNKNTRWYMERTTDKMIIAYLAENPGSTLDQLTKLACSPDNTWSEYEIARATITMRTNLFRLCNSGVLRRDDDRYFLDGEHL